MRSGSPVAFLLVAVGGAGGGLLRYARSVLLGTPAVGFDWATLAVNTAGCCALGFVVTGSSPRVRLGLGTGFLGGFTTFSAVSQTAQLTAAGGSPAVAVGYLLTSVTLGLAAGMLGAGVAARLLVRRAERRGDTR